MLTRYEEQFQNLILIFSSELTRNKFYRMRPKSRKSRPPKSEKIKHPRTSPSSPKKTHENLPNEILTQIFQNLSLKELLRAGNTCQRWKLVIAHTEKLWEMANMREKKVPVSFLNHICSRYVESKIIIHTGIYIRVANVVAHYEKLLTQ